MRVMEASVLPPTRWFMWHGVNQLLNAAGVWWEERWSWSRGLPERECADLEQLTVTLSGCRSQIIFRNTSHCFTQYHSILTLTWNIFEQDRYVEIFLYSERPNKLRFKKVPWQWLLSWDVCICLSDAAYVFQHGVHHFFFKTQWWNVPVLAICRQWVKPMMAKMMRLRLRWRFGHWSSQSSSSAHPILCEEFHHQWILTDLPAQATIGSGSVKAGLPYSPNPVGYPTFYDVSVWLDVSSRFYQVWNDFLGYYHAHMPLCIQFEINHTVDEWIDK